MHALGRFEIDDVARAGKDLPAGVLVTEVQKVPLST